MKIGIITILKTNNYGADLQAFALYKKLENLGYSAEIIDYLYFKNPRHVPTRRSLPISRLSLKDSLKEKVLYRAVNPLLEYVFPYFNASQRNRIRNFRSFLSPVRFSRPYRKLDDLYSKKKPVYEVTIVGSDQVWNPGTGSSIEPYFLTFAGDQSHKMSYASSFGTDKIDGSLHHFYREWLGNLNSISVREAQGVKLVGEISGKQAVQVLDPTLLLNQAEWSEFRSKYALEARKFILIYQLSASETLVDLAYRLKKQTGYPIFRICKRAFKEEQNEGITNIFDAGPGEFIDLFSRASFVLTNSFHGTAFSLNFGLPFYTILSKKKSNNSRMESLLGMVGLADRIVMEGSSLDGIDYSKAIDTEYVQEKLSLERQKSIDYLITGINSAQK